MMFATKVLRSAAALAVKPVARNRGGLQIVSDVHLEYRKTFPKFEQHADNLALLGDIGHPYHPSYAQFIGQQADRYDKVFVLLGNHEYWNDHGICVDNIQHQARHVCSRFSNVELLDRDSFDITENTRLLGCTLWSPINEYASNHMSDMKKIFVRGTSNEPVQLSRRMFLYWHSRDKEWLKSELKRCRREKRQAVVLSHHGPVVEMAGKYLGHPLNSGFVSDSSSLFDSPAIAFASGHVHSNVDIEQNMIRSVSNAMGYSKEGVTFKDDVVIDFE